jgi:hypothetical protein
LRAETDTVFASTTKGKANDRRSSSTKSALGLNCLSSRADINAKVEAQLKATREAALATVKSLCATHSFTATDLKGALVVKRASAAAKKATPRKSARAKK